MIRGGKYMIYYFYIFATDRSYLTFYVEIISTVLILIGGGLCRVIFGHILFPASKLSARGSYTSYRNARDERHRIKLLIKSKNKLPFSALNMSINDLHK